MSIATTAEQRAVADAIRSWGRGARPIALARGQEDDPGRWRECWATLAELGLFAAAVPVAHGGAGGTVSDLAVMLEAAAQLLVPGPVAGTALTGLLVARAESAAAAELLARLAAGDLPAAVALGPGELTAEPTAAGGYVLHGSVGPVLGADAGTALVLGATAGDRTVWVLIEAGTPGLAVCADRPADFSRALATVGLNGVQVGPDRVLTGVDTGLVRDLTAVLAGAEAAGVARWALDTATDYAKVREQFGRPIGAFQAIKHLCAEMLCRVELATALAWDAAEAAGDDAQRPVAAAACAALALDAAAATTKDCIQVLGGIGFTWEHDAHLYLRRALALRAAVGSRSARRRTAELALAGTRRELRVDLGDVTELRTTVRANAERVAALPEAERRAGLVEAGYLCPHWPRPHGLDASPVEQLVIDQELARAGVDRPDLMIAGWAVPTILAHGTAGQVERFVRPTLLGELRWCQLFSEPGAGSDLAALRTRAERTAGGWLLSGQKVWTSMARQADWAICLARTDQDAPKHKGISYFLVDMHSPGIEVRPLREITGEAVFNEVFLDGVFVPDTMLVGELNDGWKLARATLANERLAMGGGSSIGDAVERLLALAAAHGVTSDDAVLDVLGGLVADGLAGSVLELRSTLRRLQNEDPGAAAGVRKLIGVRHRQAVADAALDVLGPDGARDGEVLRHLLLTRCLTIAGGTSQVLLTLAAERILGLPRE